MVHQGFKRRFSPLKLLTEEQIENIHRNTLRVLEETGLRIEHERALKLLKSNGGKVDFDSRRAKFPPWLVEECLSKCPRTFRIKARNPENDVMLDENSVYFGMSCGRHTVDLDTLEPRPATKQEYRDLIIAMDALDNPQIVGPYPLFGWEGLPSIMCIPEGFAARLRNTSKILMTAHSNNCDIFNVEMSKVAGAETIVGPNPSPPLTYGEEAIETLYRAAVNDCPLRFGYTGEVMGATSPATIAGTVVTGSATAMAGIVLAQLIKPGIRISVGGWAFPQNMRSGLIIFGSIEQSLFHAAHSQYWRSLHMPVNHTTGFTSSKSIDYQCACEKATQTLISALAGANIIQVSGAIFGELTLHPVQMILDDDLCNMIGRFVEGIEVTDETLALELINEVGPIPGMYLDKEHTRRWWKKEQFMPKAADRLSIPEWIAKGKKSAIDYAQERMEEILATHTPAPLTPSQEEDIDRILGEAREYYRKKGLLVG